jgi:cytoskeletal protein CcmA (bactofilin family)
MGAGQNVSVKGPVDGDVFLFGETLEISADVGGDVYAMGESLFVPEDISIGGNLYFGGAELMLNGAVGGSLMGGGANIDINGSVAGDVHIEAGDVRIGPNASIGGDLVYKSPERGDISDLASVSGMVDWTEKLPSVDDGEEAGSGIAFHLAMRVFLFLSSLLIGGVLFGLFPRVLTKPAELLKKEAPVSFGIGFAVLFGVPVFALFLALFVLPIPLSLLAMAVYVPATFLARYIAAYAVGKYVLERTGKSAKPLGALVAGLALLHLAYSVPFLGGLVSLGATVLGLGALFLAARRAGRMGETVAG